MAQHNSPEWIAVDWGTTNLRAYAMRGSQVIGRLSSCDGMGALARDQFERALLRLIDPWTITSPVPIVACGMVGSRQGWVEAPYRPVPTTPMSEMLVKAPSTEGLNVHIVPGLSQNVPADVMRGEETQIEGFLSLNPGWDGVVCMPGTHTKWVHISAGEVVSFQTFMTGELFDLLSTTSVLRHSVSPDGWNETSFDEAVSDAISSPERLAARLFNLRATDLLNDTSKDTIRSALSGYLIGAELAAARAYWLGQNVAIMGMGHQARGYEAALKKQGVYATLVDIERATIAGLSSAFRLLKDNK